MTITNYTASDRMLWESLYHQNPRLSPYQSPNFMEQYLKTAKFGKRRALLQNRILKIAVDDTQVICPLAVDGHKKEVFLLGDFSAVGYCDLVYGPDITNEQFALVVAALKDYFPEHTLCLNKVNENSIFCTWLLEHYPSASQGECVSVSLGNSGEEYYKSLSKHTRQNIRTAYNRLDRNEKKWEFRVVSGKECLSSEQKNAISSIYARRMQAKFGKEVLPYPVMYVAQRYFNPIARALNSLDSQFHAMLYIDGQIAAYLSGFFNGDGSRIVVPRLSINNEFDFYDPGIVLLRETAEYLCKNRPGTELDLSRGNEKYKYMMGGKPHFNHSFVI